MKCFEENKVEGERERVKNEGKVGYYREKVYTRMYKQEGNLFVGDGMFPEKAKGTGSFAFFEEY